MAFAIHSVNLCHVGGDVDRLAVLSDKPPWQIQYNDIDHKLREIKCRTG
jgi:hypothetical protein